ncbi:glycosyltransferase [Deinococcus cellulosilyticus]|uniref:Uncharacterized protein n=1 Tax=Deinococcus cellulosilyticus (strain DSM 18568 / NBRC 106333 / KACC 11606 / 5516J-15) TaxID=1223518 RepID=A0A511N583_DEIC1|nr:glycosyltransferase [Deinococcus cellulosilyticus]GEM47596.1 hypothetical protein DC3_32310 [Deinococcus cellulosilyticus NBRC 106333 = KACC 11606]
MKIFYVTAQFPFGKSESFIIPEVEHLHHQHNLWIVPMNIKGGVILHDQLKKMTGLILAQPYFSRSVLESALRMVLARPLHVVKCFAELFQSPRHLPKNLFVFFKALWIADQARRMDIDHLHAHWLSTSATAAMIASRLTGIPWSFTAHRWDIEENNLIALKSKHAIRGRFISEAGRRLAVRQGASAATSQVIHMGVPLQPKETTVVIAEETLTMMRSLPGVRLLCPAALIELKGHRFLIEALAELQKTGLEISVAFAGDGPLKDTLQAQCAEQLAVGSYSFLGYISHDQLLALYQQHWVDMVVLPSLIEGISVAVVEAMAHQMPVVVTRAGAMDELVDETVGWIVNTGDAEALKNALHFAVHHPDVRHARAAQGQKKVFQEYEIDQVMQELIKIFQLQPKGQA